MLSVSLGDILKVLNEFKAWPRMTAAPDRIDALERRVAALETARLAPPAEACPYCQAPLRLTDEVDDAHFGIFGVKQRTFACDGCGKPTTRKFDPRKD